MGGRSLKVTSPPLKYKGYADQLKDNRAVKKCREKKGFLLYFFTNCILIVFLVY